MKKFLLCVFVILLMVLPANAAVDVAALVQECPNFSNYPGYNGVIWQKNSSYEVGPGGVMSLTRTVVLLGREGLDKKWLEWNLTTPEGGHIEILQAAVFSPGSLEEIKNVNPINLGNVSKMDFSQTSDDEFIIVLVYQRTLPVKLAVRDFLWLTDELPVWEQTVSVKVGSGENLAYRSNIDTEPKAIADDGFDSYTWMFVNQTPDSAHSLRANKRPWLVFGSGKQGYEGLAPEGDALGGSAGKNRLSLTYKLNLSEDGTLSGAITVVVRNAWRKFLSPSETLKDILGSDRIFEGKPEVKEVGGALEIGAKLRPTKIILGTRGANAIMPLSSLQPSWLAELMKVPAPYELAFQMTIESIYHVALPPRVKDILLPQNTELGFGKIKYIEKYSARNKSLELVSRLIISATKVETDSERDLKLSIQRLASPKNIPLRVK